MSRMEVKIAYFLFGAFAVLAIFAFFGGNTKNGFIKEYETLCYNDSTVYPGVKLMKLEIVHLANGYVTEDGIKMKFADWLNLPDSQKIPIGYFIDIVEHRQPTWEGFKEWVKK